MNSLPRVTISLVISTVDTHPLSQLDTLLRFSISHPLSSYVFDAIHFFCRHRAAAAVAKRNEPPRTLPFTPRLPPPEYIAYVHTYISSKRGKKLCPI